MFITNDEVRYTILNDFQTRNAVSYTAWRINANGQLCNKEHLDSGDELNLWVEKARTSDDENSNFIQVTRDDTGKTIIYSKTGGEYEIEHSFYIII